ncbi:MAG: Oligopeptide-binding protein AppA [Firmicutes bacterium]|nr:Oligopeptide-binding protein AppA [candidate division NPL-UPA2 bacterium]
MKKRLLASTLVLALFATILAVDFTAQASAPWQGLINNVPLQFDVPPVILQGRALVPMRAIFEALGATVHWDEATKTVTAYRRESAVVLTIGSRTAWVNGPVSTLDVAPSIVAGRTLVPLRFVAEALGAEVGWDGRVTISVNHAPYVTPPVGGTITFGATADPITLNPIMSTDVGSAFVHGRTNWGLVRMNVQALPMNAIADRWQWDQATLTWRFWLNPRARWQDDVPVTARDVKFTFDTIAHADYDGPRRAVVQHVQEIVVVNAHTVDFRMRQVDASFLFRIGLGLLPHHTLSTVPVRELRGHAFSRVPLANGPYRFVRWVPGQFVELARNPQFFQGPRPYIDRVVVRTFQDDAVRQVAWEVGDIDFLASISPDTIDQVRRQHANRAHFQEIMVHGFDSITVNLEHPILRDRAVRQALVTAIDRQAMVNTVLNGFGRVLHGPQVSTSWAHGATDLDPYTHSVVRARQMLDAAGWRVPARSRDGVRMKDGVRLSFGIMVQSGHVTRMDVMTMLTSYWRLIGVETIGKTIEWAVLGERSRRSQFDLMITGWAPGPDPDVFRFFHSSQAERNAAGHVPGFNRALFRNADVDRLSEAALATVDVAERTRIYHELDRILNREVPWIWLFQRSAVSAMSNRIGGVVWSPIGAVELDAWFIRR